MKKITLLSAVVATSLYANISLEWSKEYKFNDRNSTITDIVAMPNGDIVSVGYADGDIVNSDDTPPDTPDKQMLITVHNSEGNLTLVDYIGGATFPDKAIAVFPNLDDTITIVGSTVPPSDEGFGEVDIVITDYNLSSASILDSVVLGTTGRDYPESAVRDQNGNIYITGHTDGNFSDANGSLGTVIDSDVYNGNYSSFLIKVTPDGDIVNREGLDNPDYYSDYSYKNILKINEINGTEEIYAIIENDSYNSELNVFDTNLTLKDYYFLPDSSEAFDFKTEDNGSVSLFLATYYDGIKKITIDKNGTDVVGFFEDSDFNGTLTIDGSTVEPTAILYSDITDSVFVAGTYYESGNGYPIVVKKIKASNGEEEALRVIGTQTGYEYWGTRINKLEIDENGSILIGGILSDMTLVPDNNISGEGVFLAKFADSYPIISLVTGWNLVSANLDKSDFPSEVALVYQYTERDREYCEIYPDYPWYCQREWKAFSPDAELDKKLKDYAQLPDITDIQNRDGMWVYATAPVNIIAKDNDENISTDKYPLGWSLNGIGVDKNVSQDMFCNNFDNNESNATEWVDIKSIWKFDAFSGELLVNTPDASFMPSINRFEMIMKNEGFWVNCESNVTQ